MERINANSVLNTLRERLWHDDAHAWLYEVRNRTGYGGRERYADAIVVSLWPSRGIWIAGIEVKVNRQDWLKELKAPEKSQEIQKYCDYWWIAAPEGVVLAGEYPKAWGYVEIGHDKKGNLKPFVKWDAPKLQPEPMSPVFVASVLRNHARVIELARKEGYEEGCRATANRQSTEHILDLEKKIFDLELLKDQNERKEEYRLRDKEQFEYTIKEFERITGMNFYSIKNGSLARCFGIAERLNCLGIDPLLKQMKAIVESIEKIKEIDKA